MSSPAGTPGAGASAAASAACPACGAERPPDAAFCEQCGHDFGAAVPTPATAGPTATRNGETQTRHAPVRAQTADEGLESPLDLGWTGPVSRGAATEVDPAPAAARCAQCGTGGYLDGYCDTCGAKQPDPRDHFAESPAAWVGGVCDIGRRHSRNEDAMALLGSTRPLQQAVLVVCDGVSNTTDSHIASLAAARAAREVLDDPVPRGMGLPDAVVGVITKRLGDAVVAARQAVVETTPDVNAPTPPSCTFVAALIDEGLAVVGNVGDSRAYWLPDAPTSEPRQLSADDSFAAEQMREGMPRKDAETGPNAHAITRWLGIDSPDDLTPHTASLQLTEDGWLMLCSDGLWNYCSDAVALRQLVADTVAGLGDHGLHPPTLAQALVDFANARGGVDNITVALARVGATAGPPPVASAVVEPAAIPANPTAANPTAANPTAANPTAAIPTAANPVSAIPTSAGPPGATEASPAAYAPPQATSPATGAPETAPAPELPPAPDPAPSPAADREDSPDGTVHD